MRYKVGQRVLIDSPNDPYHCKAAIVHGAFQHARQQAYTVKTEDKQVHSMLEDELCSDYSNRHRSDYFIGWGIK